MRGVGRRKFSGKFRSVDPDVVDELVREIRVAFVRTPLLALELHDSLKEKRGKDLLTALMSLQPAERRPTIYQ